MAKSLLFGAYGSIRRIVSVSVFGLVCFAVLGFVTHNLIDTRGVGILIVVINALKAYRADELSGK